MSTPAPTSRELDRPLLIGAVVLITVGAFENLAVTTILPVIARDLDGFAIYALAAGLPLALQVVASAVGGLLIDAISFQRPLLAGALTSAAGLLIAGFAPEMWLLALGRGIAGFGFGTVAVSLYAAVGLVIAPPRRPTFFAAFSAAWVVPGMVGPALAGVLADAGLWRAVLLGVLPFSVIALILLRPILKSPPTVAADTAPIRTRARGVVPAALGLAIALAALQTAGAGGRASIGAAVVAFLAVLVILPLLLPRGTFRLRLGVPSAVAARLFLNGGVVGMETYLALFLQEGRGWSPSAAGLVLTAGSISWATGAAVQSRLTGERRRYRWAVAGSTFVAAGVALTALVVLPPVPTALAPFAWLIAGFGMGVTFSSLSVFSLDNTPAPKQGEISAALQIADGSGAALSIAIGGVMITLLGRTDAGFAGTFLALLVVALLAVIATSRVRNVTGTVSAADDATA
ncbi:MAG TPA: MFS transporter [Actinomycetaceae bacterium]|nr:MFS transporter [Actinomycetaceae bacterium]